MKVTGSTIQQLDKSKPRSRCRDWRLWATTEEGRKSERFHGTYTQAQEALKRFVSELEGKVPNSDTFGAYAESWRLWREKSGNYSPNTVREDKRKVAMLLRTDLSGMRMDEVTPEACREALSWLREHPARKSGEYTNTTLEKSRQTLYAVFQQALDDGKVARNPVASVAFLKPDTKERTALTPDELGLFLNRVDEMQLDGRVMALYMVACLGLRRGEACAVLDADVSDVAVVRSAVRSADNSVGSTKSAAGVRTLPMPARLSRKVAEWRALRDRLGYGDRPELCLNFRGGPLTPNTFGEWWIRARDSLGCPGMVLHDLRHSNLSMMARHMGVFDLQRYAGWSSIAPAKVYVHDDLDAVSRAVEMAWK